MSELGERLLMQHLSDRDSLDTLAREGLPPECVPTEDLRKVYVWALDSFHRGGRTKAPSVAAIRSEFGNILDDYEMDIEEEPSDTIEMAIDDLKGSYIWRETQVFNKAFASEMSEAGTVERVDVVNRYASLLVQLGVDMESHENRVDAREALHSRIQAYEDRVADHNLIHGMQFGLEEIDLYTRGIHPGELAVIAAGPKVGKSYLLTLIALNEWKAGRSVTFFTLENSVEMTLDRLACLACGVNSRDWQAGTCEPGKVEQVEQWIRQMQGHDNPLHIIQPELGQRTVDSLVRQAQLNNSDSLIIDQLSFLEVEDERAPRYLQIRELTHRLKSLCSTGRQRMPVVLAHQINREGVQMADKKGYLEMYHLAEGSEVERTADWVFGIHRSISQRGVGVANFQTLASRREDIKNYEMQWDVGAGKISVNRPILNLETTTK